MAKEKNTGRTPMEKAVKFLASRARTVREVELHLDENNFGEYEVYQTVERLKELGYLNDDVFAHDFVETRLNTKPVSRRKLREQMKAHQLEEASIEKAIAEIDDEAELENARKTAEKFIRLLEIDDEFELRDRVYKRLLSRGYETDTIKQAIEIAINERKD